MPALPGASQIGLQAVLSSWHCPALPAMRSDGGAEWPGLVAGSPTRKPGPGSPRSAGEDNSFRRAVSTSRRSSELTMPFSTAGRPTELGLRPFPPFHGLPWHWVSKKLLVLLAPGRHFSSTTVAMIGSSRRHWPVAAAKLRITGLVGDRDHARLLRDWVARPGCFCRLPADARYCSMLPWPSASLLSTARGSPGSSVRLSIAHHLREATRSLWMMSTWVAMKAGRCHERGVAHGRDRDRA